MSTVRLLITALGLLLAWDLVVRLSGVPKFILPAPASVGVALIEHAPLLLRNAGITGAEIVLGILLGTVLGVGLALAITASPAARRWLMPLLVGSQALPVFALAPLLVLWLGYGLASKIAMTVLIIFFPVATSFFDGLRRIEPGWLELARSMDAIGWRTLCLIRVPAALPAMASGLRVAAAVAPIGAIIGEWVGASAGLGFLMLQANSRMETDVMFAAVAILTVMTLVLYAAIDRLCRRIVYWQTTNA